MRTRLDRSPPARLNPNLARLTPRNDRRRRLNLLCENRFSEMGSSPMRLNPVLRISLAVLLALAPAGKALAQAAPIYTDQGPNWTPQLRAEFYSKDQGAKMMPLAWLQAL